MKLPFIGVAVLPQSSITGQQVVDFADWMNCDPSPKSTEIEIRIQTTELGRPLSD